MSNRLPPPPPPSRLPPPPPVTESQLKELRVLEEHLVPSVPVVSVNLTDENFDKEVETWRGIEIEIPAPVSEEAEEAEEAEDNYDDMPPLIPVETDVEKDEADADTDVIDNVDNDLEEEADDEEADDEEADNEEADDEEAENEEADNEEADNEEADHEEEECQFIHRNSDTIDGEIESYSKSIYNNLINVKFVLGSIAAVGTLLFLALLNGSVNNLHEF